MLLNMDNNGCYNADKEFVLKLEKGQEILITFGDLYRSTGQILDWDKNGDLQVKLLKTNGISVITIGVFLIHQFMEGKLNRLCIINF